MPTTLYFREAAASMALGKGINQFNDEWPPQTGTLRAYLCKALSTTRGAAATTAVVNTITSGVALAVLLTKTAGAPPGLIFISEPVDQDVTIAGAITWNLRAAESDMVANAAINATVYRLAKDLNMTLDAATIDATARTIEVAVTTETVNNFAETPAAGVTLQKGDRLLIHVGFGAAGTMASGFNCTLWYDGPTAAASGDSFVTFTETFGFLTTAPAGSQLFLTDEAGPEVHGSRTERKMWTSRGGGVVSKQTTCRMTASYNSLGIFYANDISSGVSDALRTGVRPLVARDGDSVIAEQIAELGTTHTPLLDGTTDTGAQSFLPGADAWCYCIAVRLSKTGSGTPVYTFGIYNDNGSDRPGTLRVDNTLLTFGFLSTGAYNYVLIGENADWDAVFPVVEEGTLLTNAVKYWARILTTTGSAVAAIQTVGADGSNDNYVGGSRIHSIDSGVNWTQPANEDWAFKILGGRILEWYTPLLNGFTLANLVRVNARVQGSDAATGMGAFAALWRVNGDGSSPTLYGIGQMNNASGGLLTAAEAAYQFDISGDDLVVSAGQRLRLRVYTFGTPESAMVEGDSFTLYYNGTSGGASGDSWIQLSQSVSEQVAAAPSFVIPPARRRHHALARR